MLKDKPYNADEVIGYHTEFTGRKRVVSRWFFGERVEFEVVDVVTYDVLVTATKEMDLREYKENYRWIR